MISSNRRSSAPLLMTTSANSTSDVINKVGGGRDACEDEAGCLGAVASVETTTTAAAAPQCRLRSSPQMALLRGVDSQKLLQVRG